MGVEQAPIQKIVAMIDATYLEYVRDRTTNSINLSGSVLLVHLQETYGTLMPHDPIASVFSVVDDLVKISVLAATPLSSAQQVNIGYVILHKTGKFSPTSYRKRASRVM